MKKNKLYTANKWNTNLFAGGGDTNQEKKGGLLNSLGNVFASSSPYAVAAQVVGALLDNGYQSTVGDSLKNIPVFGTAVGGVVNNLFGAKENTANVNSLKAHTEAANQVGQGLVKANTTNDFLQMSGNMVGVSGLKANDLYKNGLFGHAGTRKGNALLAKDNTALAFQNHASAQGAYGVDQNQDNFALSSFYAFGGPIDELINTDNMNAIQYGFLSDYLDNKRKQTEAQNKFKGTTFFSDGGSIKIKHPGRLTALKKRTGKTEAELYNDGNPDHKKMVVFARNARKWNHAYGGPLFDLGGDLQADGADFTTGLTHINAGGTHEENPNEGVPMGVDPNGTPNLVEEGETIWDDYVFSNRIQVNDEVKKLFHINKKRDITYADLSKKLEKEASERPNDPISQAGLKAQMTTLKEAQEAQKAEMEAQKAQEAFSQLSPEEQVAMMQQLQGQPQEQPVVSPEEEALMQQQLMGEQQPMVPEEGGGMPPVPIAAEGGQLAHLYAAGSKLAKKIANKYDNNWFLNRAKSLGMIDNDAETLEGFVYDANDPDSNLANFNNLYRAFQRNKALETYVQGQRQAKENELFGTTGSFRLSDDGTKIYKYKIAPEDVTTWMDKNNASITQEEYDKLKDDDKAGYRRIVTKAGDRITDYYGKPVEELQKDATVDSILDSFDYEKGFKWDDTDAQAINYPVSMDFSKESNLRYAPALGGLIGLGFDLFSSPDYSNADRLIRESDAVAPTIQPHYIGDYLTYRPMDIWAEQNRLNASAGATRRALLNNSSPSRMAGLLAAGYNDQIASGDLYRKALEYNDALRAKVAEFNRSTNIQNADMDYKTQAANINSILNGRNNRFKGLLYGTQMRDEIDNRRSASLSANLTNILTSLGNIGEEAYDRDRLKWLEGTDTLRSNVYNTGSKNAKYGGMLTKKSKKGGNK